LTLTASQIERLVESRVQFEAAGRANYADDTSAAVIGSIDKDGHKALQQHIRALRAIADGTPAEGAGIGYTSDDAIVL
jgi:hypothetical protein